MTLSRREALVTSSATVAGLAFAAMAREDAHALGKPPQAPWPDGLVETPLRPGFPVALPLNADGSAPERPVSEAGPIVGRLMWRTPDGQPPPGGSDYSKMAIKVNTRGLAERSGTLHFSDLEQLPRVSHTYLMQCAAPEPHGVVKWTGVKFADFADMLGPIKGPLYCRLVATDRQSVDEAIDTLRHPQVMLAWMMNDQPLPMAHGAPLRLVVPFRYGNRSIKAITEIIFATSGLPMPPLPS